MTQVSADQSAELLVIAQHTEATVRSMAPANVDADAATVTALTMALGRAVAHLVINRGGDAHSLAGAAGLSSKTLAAAISANYAYLTALAAAPTAGGVQ